VLLSSPLRSWSARSGRTLKSMSFSAKRSTYSNMPSSSQTVISFVAVALATTTHRARLLPLSDRAYPPR
jgi:hypothetical protein